MQNRKVRYVRYAPTVAAFATCSACSLLVSTAGLAGSANEPSDAGADLGPLSDLDAHALEGPNSGGTISIAQTAANSCSACDHLNVTLDRAVAGGSLLVAFLYTCAPADSKCPTPTLADSLANAWSGPVVVGSAGTGADYMWYACGSAGGSDVVLVQSGSAVYGLSLHVHEVRGIVGASCLDALGTSSGTGSSASVTTNSPAGMANEYVVAFFGHNGAAGASSYAPGVGFALERSTLSSVNDAAMSESALSAVANHPATATATSSVSSATWHAILATFHGSP
jgi:hypothetical protein